MNFLHQLSKSGVATQITCKIDETPPSDHKQTIPSKKPIITQIHNKNTHQHTNTIANIKKEHKTHIKTINWKITQTTQTEHP